MIPSLSQEEMTQYASDAQTIQEPTGLDFTQGVHAGRTVPAKWWNWLFSAATKRIVQSRNDANNMLTELKNVVTDAGLTPSGSDNTQLTQAIEAKTLTQIDTYVEDKKRFMEEWYLAGVEVDGLTLTKRYPSSTTTNMDPRVYRVQEQNGIYFGLAQGYDTSVSPEVYHSHVAFSQDLVHWTSIINRNFGTTTVKFGTVFFAGAWFVPTFFEGAGHLYKSTDRVNWTEVSFGSGGLADCTLFILNNTLYMIDVSVSTGITTHKLRSTQDGETWSSQEISCAFVDTSYPFHQPGPNKVAQVTHLSGTKYLIGATLLLDTSLMSLTILPEDESDHYLIPFNGYYYTRGTVSTPTTYKIATDGTIGTVNMSVDLACSSEEMLVVSGTDGGISTYSFDGTTFNSFPNVNSLFGGNTAYVFTVKKINNKWFLTASRNLNYATAFKVLVADNLSASLSDYTVVYEGQLIPNAGTGSSTNYGDLLFNILENGMISVANVMSKDGGVTWFSGQAERYFSVTGFAPASIFAVINGKYFGITKAGNMFTIPNVTLVFYTINGINRVVGNTLYLR